jgi:hypothetical protein
MYTLRKTFPNFALYNNGHSESPSIFFEFLSLGPFTAANNSYRFWADLLQDGHV